MASLSGKKILVVDDLSDVRYLARRILESDGATVVDVDGATPARATLLSTPYSLILTDLHMPDVSGFELLEFIRSDETLRDTPTLVLSAMNDRASVTRAISLGATDYLLKPFSPGRLLQKIRKLLQLPSFRSLRYLDPRLSPATISIEVQISHLTEQGCRIEAPIQLSQVDDISLDSDTLRYLGMEAIGVMPSGAPTPREGVPTLYRDELRFSELGPARTEKFRQRLGVTFDADRLRGHSTATLNVRGEIIEVDELGLKIYCSSLPEAGSRFRLTSELFIAVGKLSGQCIVGLRGNRDLLESAPDSFDAEFEGTAPEFMESMLRWLQNPPPQE